jgi:hypothetical protein
MGFTQVYDYSAGKQSPRHPVRRLGLASPGGPDSVLASHAAKLASFGPQCADWPTP